MKETRMTNFEVVQGSNKDWIFEQRETQIHHSPYAREQMVFDCIRDGNLARLDQMLQDASQTQLFVGKLSSNSLRQAQYLAVAFMTLATRAAIQGGMFEMDAYNKSDAFIQKVDQQVDAQEVLRLTSEMTRSMAEEMHLLQVRKTYSPQIRACLEFIYQNLHSRIDLPRLAQKVNLSTSYLCRLFKKEVGVNLSNYIIAQKIQAAKAMMKDSRMSVKEISNYLEFSSQSYFINCFKRECGVTPGVFMRQAGFRS